METHGLTAAVLRLECAAESPAEVVKPDYWPPEFLILGPGVGLEKVHF